jgi:protein TonB
MALSEQEKEFKKERMKKQFKGIYKWGLIISILIHGTIIGMLAMPKGEDEVKKEQKKLDGKVKVVKYDELPPPPSIVPQVTMPQGLPGEGSVGEIPMPVPDEEAEKETISDIVPGFEDGVPGGDMVVDTSDVKVEDASIDQIEFVPYEERPVMTREVKPDYPAIGREAGTEGTVQLMVYVGTDGKVKNVFVTGPMEIDAFNQAAVDAAYQCQFTPAKMSGVPVGVWISLPMHFKLH